MAISTPAARILSAVRSMNTPSLLTEPWARATRPSTTSEIAAAAKSANATSPPPGHGARMSQTMTGVATMRATPSAFGTDASEGERSAIVERLRSFADAPLRPRPQPGDVVTMREEDHPSRDDGVRHVGRLRSRDRGEGRRHDRRESRAAE